MTAASEINKTCSKCKEEKTLDQFHNDNSTKDKKLRMCKSCVSERGRAYYNKNKEQLKKRPRGEYRANNKHAMAVWRSNNPDKARQKAKEYYAKNKERYKKRYHRYYENNRDAMLARAKEYSASPKGKALSRAHMQRRRAWKKGALCGEAIGILELLDVYGPVCYICGIVTDPSASRYAFDKSEIDHVVALANGGNHLIDNLRVACRECNNVKGARFTPQETCERITIRRLARTAALNVSHAETAP